MMTGFLIVVAAVTPTRLFPAPHGSAMMPARQWKYHAPKQIIEIKENNNNNNKIKILPRNN
jgi:hypothetical protein